MSPNTPDSEPRKKLRHILHFMNDEEEAIAQAPLEEIKKELRHSGIDPEALIGRLNSEKARVHKESVGPVQNPQSVMAGIRQTLGNWLRSLAPVYSFAVVLIILVGVVPLLVSGPKTAYRGLPQRQDILRRLSRLNGEMRQFEHAKNYGQAAVVGERMVTLVSQYRGADHPDTAVILNNLALMYKKNKQTQRAMDTYLRAVAIQKATLGAGHKDTVVTMENLLILYQDLGMTEKSAQLRSEINDFRR